MCRLLIIIIRTVGRTTVRRRRFLVNVVSKWPTNAALVITVKPMFLHLTPLPDSGFAGVLRRLFSIKKLLDDQWDSDRVYQEDYFSLLTATETGQLTYSAQRTERVCCYARQWN